VRGSRENGKHRTEVTEVTEGELDWSADVWREHRGLGAKIARRQETPEGKGEDASPTSDHRLCYFWSIWHFNFNGIRSSVV